MAKIRFNHNYEPEIWTCANPACGNQWLASSRQVQKRRWEVKNNPKMGGPFCGNRCKMVGRVNGPLGRHGWKKDADINGTKDEIPEVKKREEI